MWNLLTNARVEKSRTWRWEVQCFLLKDQIKRMFVFENRKWDTAWLESVKTETLSKKEETEMTDPWSVHEWERDRHNKKREGVNEMNLMHGHVLLHKIVYCITLAYCIKHMSSSHLKQEGRVLHLIKASERPSGRKKIIQIDQSFNPFKIQPTGNQV